MGSRDLPADFGKRYKKALKAYLKEANEDALQEAYELGREALEPDVGLLGLVNLHEDVVEELIGDESVEMRSLYRTTEHFLLESLSVFEVMRLRHLDAHKALQRLNHMLEEEAHRIALLLHDDSAQLLATVYLELAEIERDRSTRSIGEHVGRIKGHLDRVSQQLRHISHELSPPSLHQLGLIPALNYLAEGINKRSGVDVNIRRNPGSQAKFTPEIETALYRTVQEALNNVVRHAQANRVTVSVRTEGHSVICTIVDDGIGFDPAVVENKAGGLGMRGMRERAHALRGKVHVESSPGAGTTVLTTLPLESNHDDEKTHTVGR